MNIKTECNSCVHEKVCSYEKSYKNTVDSIKGMENDIHKQLSGFPYIEFNIACKYYLK